MDNLKSYLAIDEETGEEYSKILYLDGNPTNIRADLKIGGFGIGDDKSQTEKKIKVLPIAYRQFISPMFLPKDQIEKAEMEGEDVGSLAKEWLELFYLKSIGDGAWMVCHTIFKTWSKSNVLKALSDPTPIKKGNRFMIPKLTDLLLELSFSTEKNGYGTFFKVEAKKEIATPELTKMANDFIADHNIYAVDTLKENLRYRDYFQNIGYAGAFSAPSSLVALPGADQQQPKGLEESF